MVGNSQRASKLSTLSGHHGSVLSLCTVVAPEQAALGQPVVHQVASCSADWTVRLWSTQSLECLRTLQGNVAVAPAKEPEGADAEPTQTSVPESVHFRELARVLGLLLRFGVKCLCSTQHSVLVLISLRLE